jgi:hypothetical protein
MNLALWIVAGLLAVAYMFSGAGKLIMSKEKIAAMSEATGWVEDFSPGSLKTIGALEVLAAVGLILPAALDVAPRACVSAVASSKPWRAIWSISPWLPS